MRHIFVTFLLGLSLFANNLVKSEVIGVTGDEAHIKVPNIEVGMSGFIVRTLAPERSTIIEGATVVDYDKNTEEATLKLYPYTVFVNNNLPRGKWHTKKGDLAVLAFAYNRGLLIAPSEKIYYTLTRAMQGEVFVHPDIFATLLSFKGHPTPLQEDFREFCNNVSIGLLFFYMEERLYTVDCQSFHILGVQEAPLKQESQKLPFYSRLKKIEANWFGEGSDELEDYEPYYYKLLYKNNTDNEKLKNAIATSSDANVSELAKELDIKEGK